MNALSVLDADPLVVLRVLAAGLAISIGVAVIEGALRQALWSVWHFATTFFAFLARVTLTFVVFLSRLIAEAIDGLAEEASGGPRPWTGWLLVGPLLYCTLMLTFMASDLTVAILIFEAMGLTLGQSARAALPIPLDAAMGVVFVALAMFFGIVFFDVLELTPFSFIWRALQARSRRRLSYAVGACLLGTVVAGMTMGLWSQAQLRGGLPEPWQTVLPWLIRASLVALLIGATALSGKPFGSALTAALVLLLLLVRALAYVLLAVLRLVVAVLRASLHVVLAVLALMAHVGHSLWNWCAGFAWAERLHVQRLAWPELPDPGGDAHSPEAF